MIHHGSCHCGAVKFTVEAPPEITVSKCNCSICSQTGFLHLIVKAGEFTLLQGKDNLTLYSFNSHTARHLFCKTCGVKSFYVPRSHPNGYSVNINCLNRKRFTKIIIEDFDGQNWEDNINQLI